VGAGSGENMDEDKMGNLAEQKVGTWRKRRWVGNVEGRGGGKLGGVESAKHGGTGRGAHRGGV
jgi:hypothetical protein